MGLHIASPALTSRPVEFSQSPEPTVVMAHAIRKLLTFLFLFGVNALLAPAGGGKRAPNLDDVLQFSKDAETLGRKEQRGATNS